MEADTLQNELIPDQRKDLRLEEFLPVLNTFDKWIAGDIKSGDVLLNSTIGN